MSTDIYSCAMRVKGKKLPATELPDLAINLLLGEDSEFSNFEFLKLSDDSLLYTEDAWSWGEAAGRRYELFSWLGCRDRGCLKPLVEDVETLAEQTEVFVDRVDETCSKSFEKEYLFNVGPQILLLPLAFLRSFNYDLPIPGIQKVEYEGRAKYLERFAFYEGKTYRDFFPEEWFRFLVWSEQNDWDYLVYQFVN